MLFSKLACHIVIEARDPFPVKKKISISSKEVETWVCSADITLLYGLELEREMEKCAKEACGLFGGEAAERRLKMLAIHWLQSGGYNSSWKCIDLHYPV